MARLQTKQDGILADFQKGLRGRTHPFAIQLGVQTLMVWLKEQPYQRKKAKLFVHSISINRHSFTNQKILVITLQNSFQQNTKNMFIHYHDGFITDDWMACAQHPRGLEDYRARHNVRNSERNSRWLPKVQGRSYPKERAA